MSSGPEETGEDLAWRWGREAEVLQEHFVHKSLLQGKNTTIAWQKIAEITEKVLRFSTKFTLQIVLVFKRFPTQKWYLPTQILVIKTHSLFRSPAVRRRYVGPWAVF